ncbi:hypothetical protein IWX90DRAFT_6179 [Phyllosticta citrichinensis]|uniref:Uncharacterized protein n=1 Tax=Phyllosticta citrichinensis TaxID=1130410 RepID=A0ABR1Y5X1_9PEZI
MSLPEMCKSTSPSSMHSNALCVCSPLYIHCSRIPQTMNAPSTSSQHLDKHSSQACPAVSLLSPHHITSPRPPHARTHARTYRTLSYLTYLPFLAPVLSCADPSHSFQTGTVDTAGWTCPHVFAAAVDGEVAKAARASPICLSRLPLALLSSRCCVVLWWVTHLEMVVDDGMYGEVDSNGTCEQARTQDNPSAHIAKDQQTLHTFIARPTKTYTHALPLTPALTLTPPLTRAHSPPTPPQPCPVQLVSPTQPYGWMGVRRRLSLVARTHGCLHACGAAALGPRLLDCWTSFSA